MTRDGLSTLQALNPVPDSTAPSIDRFRRYLDAAHLEPGIATRSTQRARSSARRSEWGSRLAMTLAGAIVIVIAAGAVLLLRHDGRQSGQSSTAGAHPSLTEILGVLRRPQTAADRKITLPPHFLSWPIQSVTPAGRTVSHRVTVISSLERVVSPLPYGQRVELIPVRVHPADAGRYPGHVALAVASAGGAGCCSTAAQIESGEAFSSSGGAGQKNVGVLIVPDGVARVRLELPHPTTLPVHENVAVVQTSADLENLDQYRMIWYAENGHVVKRFAVPRDNKPTAAQVEARRNLALRIAARSHVRIRPEIQSSYPLFGPGLSTLTGGAGGTRFTVSHASLNSLPTGAIAMAGTVSKYRTDPRDTLLLHLDSGLNLWLAAGGRLCIFTTADKDDACTAPGGSQSGLALEPARQPGPRVIVALIPANNSVVTLNTTDGARSAPVRDGLAVIPAARVTSLTFKTKSGQTITRHVHPHD